MRAFTLIWSGQMVSFLGTAMTQFALLIFVWTKTHQATATVLLAFFQFVPLLVATPIAGAYVDRWNRKKAMIISDLIAGIGSIAILVLFTANVLEVWHLYVVGLFVGAFNAFQWPAFSAAITLLVDKKHYARTSGMMGLTEATSMIFGPPLAAVLIVTVGIPGVLLVDIVTFTYAIGILLPILIPQPPPLREEEKQKSIWKDSVYGFRYICARRALLLLVLVFFMYNFFATFAVQIFSPMILARTGDNELILGSVMSVLGIGGLIGGITIAVWGGPKKKINGLLGGMILAGFGGFAAFPDSPIAWALGGFLFLFLGPIVNGCSQAIWQSKTAPAVQGRVFAARRFIAQISGTFGLLLVGPLVDYVFEPGFDVGGSMAGLVSWFVEPGPGVGMAFVIFLAIVLSSIVALIAYFVRDVRNIEDILPDFDAEEESEKEKKDQGH
jgi:DHA3 family macrolide efflux protein-like MFS transporter